MEKFLELRQKAEKKIKIADHILLSSYTLLHDTKLLLSSVNTIYESIESAMDSVLEYERLFKRIPPLGSGFESRFSVFKKVAKAKKLDKKHLDLLRTIRDIKVSHDNSPVEFRRKDKFVIANEDYQLKTLDLKDLKKYLYEAKVFIRETTNLTSENDRIFRRS